MYFSNYNLNFSKIQKMRSQSYQSSPITYENISNRINRLKIIGNTKSNIKNNPYNFLKS